MAISKKIRFEIFKRDGFKCAYCGKSPPQIILEIDHIDPRAGGGKDDINNLVTACFDCNRGKKDVPLNKIPPTLSDNLSILQEQEEQIREYRKFVKKIERRVQKDIDDINEIYLEAYTKWQFSDVFKNGTLKTFLRLLPKDQIISSLQIAISKYPNDKDRVINYFCGICWHKIKGNEPNYLIKSEWKRLSTLYGRGSGYCKDSDIESIQSFPFQYLQNLMRETFKERRENYWSYFMGLIEEDQDGSH